MTSSTVSSTTSSTAAIDVAGMVAGLMAVENVPLTKLQSKIAVQNTKISDLGQLKAKAATFQASLNSLENPASFTSAVASSSNESVVKVASASGAITGSHEIAVNQLARPAEYIFNNANFTTATERVGFIAGTTQFSLAVAGTSYSITVDSSTTIQNLSDSINALGANVVASVTQTTSNQYGLVIQGTQSGVTNDLTFSVNNGANPLIAGSSQQAQDAKFTLDGVSFTRASNSISDALAGTTLNLVSRSAGSTATINLVLGADNGPTLIQNMITAFNDLATTAKSYTQSASSDGATPAGPLAGSLGATSFIDQIKSMLALGATYNNAGTSTTLGLYQLGIDIQKDGTLKFNASEYGSTSNLPSILASGVNVGSTSFSNRANNLNSFLTSEVQPFGILDQSISNEQDNLMTMTQSQQSLQMRLNAKQAAYTAQYSSLNALLFTLNQTSNSLTSALAGLTTGQNNR